MNRLLPFSTLLVLCFPNVAVCQQDSCDLQITCSPGVRVFINRSMMGVTSEDSNGLFVRGLAPGQYTVEAVKDGFQKQICTVIIAPGEKLKQLEIPDQWTPSRQPGESHPQANTSAQVRTEIPAPRKFQLGLMLAVSFAAGDEAFDGNGPLGGGLSFRFKPLPYFDMGFQFGLLVTCFRFSDAVSIDYLPESDPNHQELDVDVCDGTGFLMNLSLRGILPATRAVDLFACLDVGYILGLGIAHDYYSYNGSAADPVDDGGYNGSLRIGPSLGIEFNLGRTFTICFQFGLLAMWNRFEIVYDNGKDIEGSDSLSRFAIVVNVCLSFGFRI